MQSRHRNTEQVRIDDAFLRKYPNRLVVWWYGPITKNNKAGSVPLAVVFFRILNDAGNPTDWLQREVALTHLGLLRIGSVWRKGVREGTIEHLPQTFDVDFSEGGWSCVSPSGAVERQDNPIPDGEYPLRFSRDRNYLLDFTLARGGNLLVPCMEFYARCYGRSAEVKRVLATYPWEEAEGRLFKSIDEQVQPNTWPVKLAKRMRNDDVVFLAHVKYDDYARTVVKSIYSQAEAAFATGGRETRRAFLRAVPWFRGPAQIKVAGIPLNGGRTFLALRILGASQPQGDTIIRDRENPGRSTDTRDVGDSDPNAAGRPVRRLRNLLPIVDLTSDDEPDHGSSSVDIEEDRFEPLGKLRVVIDRRTAAARGLVRRVSSGESITSLSTGEPHGPDEGIGYGSIHASVVLESQGALREMWNAASNLPRDYPDTIRSVGWFTFERGFASGAEPSLILLPPARGDGGKVKSTWVYHDVAAQLPRGVLVMTIEAPGTLVYLLEIQRRTFKNGKDGEKSEEPLRGLAIAMRNGQDPRHWLRKILAGVQEQKGVMQRLIGQCPGTAYAYKHVMTASGEALYKTAVLNALVKVGVALTSTAQHRTRQRGSS